MTITNFYTVEDTLTLLVKYQQLAYRINYAKGWHETPRDALHTLALISTEIEETIDACESECGKRSKKVKAGKGKGEIAYASRVVEECADIVIRLWDMLEEFKFLPALDSTTNAPVQCRIPLRSNPGGTACFDVMGNVLARALPIMKRNQEMRSLLESPLGGGDGIPDQSPYAGKCVDKLIPHYEKALLVYCSETWDASDSPWPMTMFRIVARVTDLWRNPKPTPETYAAITNGLADLYCLAIAFGLWHMKAREPKLWNDKRCIKYGTMLRACRAKIRYNSKREHRHGGKRA
jgi:hypothetical protein